MAIVGITTIEGRDRETRDRLIARPADAVAETLDAKPGQARVVINEVGDGTNLCLESPARDAMMLDTNVVMVEDGNAACYGDDHLAGLTSFYQNFGNVRPGDDVIGMLE